MKRILGGFLALGICVTPLTVPAVAQQTLSPQNLLLLVMGGELLAQSQDAQKAKADQLLQQGVKQFQASEFQIALQSWQQALAIYQAIGNPKGEASSLGSLGNAYDALGQYQRAIEFHQQALTINRAIGNRKGEANSLGGLGNAYDSLGQHQRAIEFYQQSLAIARKIGDRKQEAASLLNLGSTYDSLGQYQRAIKFFQQSLAIFQKRDDRGGAARSLGNLGIAYDSLGQHQRAIEFFEQSLAILREIGDRLGEAASLRNLGITYKNLGQYQRAIEFYQQSLAIERKIGDRSGEAASLGNLGNAYGSLGQYEREIKFHQQSLAIERKIGDRSGETETLSNLGVAYQNLGQYQRAIELHQQSLAIERKIGNRQGETNSLGNLGNVYDSLGQYQRAVEFHQQSLAIAREIGNRRVESYCLGNLGNAYYFLGQYQQAIEFHQQSLAIARKIGDRRGEANSLGNLGNVYDSLEQYQRAIEFFQLSLTIAREIGNHQGEANTLGSLGNTYDSLGQYQRAIDFYQQSLAIFQKIGDRSGEGTVLNNLGNALFNSGNLAEAEKTLRTGIQVQESLRTKLTDLNKVSIFEGQARTYRNLQKVLIAQSKLDAALEIAERGRARAFVELLATQLASNRKVRDALALRSTITPPSIQKIQQIAKEQNATLVEYSIVPDDFKVQGIEQIRESKLFIWVIQPTGEMTFRQVNLKPLWQQPETAEPKTSFSYSWRSQVASWGYPVIIVILIVVIGLCIGLAVWGGRLVKTSPASHRQLAPRLLLFVVAACSTVGLLWLANQNLLSRDFATRSEQQPKTALAELIFSTHESSEKGIRGLAEIASGKTRQSPKERLQQLHQLLIQPIADLLPTDPNSRVIFIPQGDLFFVPFPALQDANGKHLIEKHTILTAPSIQALELTHQRRQELATRQNKPLQSQDALVVGNPTMPKVASVPGEPPEQLKPLPGAEREAKEIAKRLNTQAIIGNQATKAAIVQQMPKARLIHLATHGLLDDLYNGDIPGAIALAPSGKDDGLLRASEILKLKLNANLIVLSACNTGQGRITEDGVIGLSRSLFTAGVPSVIVSLWAVPDAPTAFLMTNFYKNLQQNPDKAHALRQAMLTTLKKYPNPRDWAAFTLIGEAE